MKHNTAENRQHVVDGAIYANDKMDEMGIDKAEVAEKAGNGLWAGMKAMFK